MGPRLACCSRARRARACPTSVASPVLFDPRSRTSQPAAVAAAALAASAV